MRQLLTRPLSFMLIVAVLVSGGILFKSAPVRAQATPKPTVSAVVNDKTASVKGILGSYCWPDDAGTPQCEIVDEPEPKAEIAVKAGDTLGFTIDPAAGLSIDVVKASLLDDRDAKGDPTTVFLTLLPTVPNAVYTVPADLKPGKHRIQAEVYYVADAKGNENFVFYAFLLNVAPGDVVLATAPATQAVAAVPTNAATPAATANGTSATIAAATISAATLLAPTSATQDSTVVSATMNAMATNVMNGTLPAMPAATVDAATLDAATVAAMTAISTVTPIPPTLVPSSTPTLIPPTLVPTSTPTAIPPTPIPMPTAVPSGVPAAFPAPDQVVPAMTLVLGAKEFKPIAIEGYELKPNGVKVSVSGPVNGTQAIAEASIGTDAIFIFKGSQPTDVKLITRDSGAIKIISQSSAPASNVVLTALPGKAGTYILTIEVSYPGGRAAYFFRVTVK